MPRYEVESADETFEVSGDTWLIALSRALARVGKDVSALGRLSIALDRAGAVSARHPEEGWDMRLCPVEDLFGGEDDVLGWLPAPAAMARAASRCHSRNIWGAFSSSRQPRSVPLPPRTGTARRLRVA